MKKVFLDELPRWKSGTYKGKINWIRSIGLNVKFIYNDIKGEIEIVDYYRNDKNKSYLIIKYKNKIDCIQTNCFSKCRIGKILGKITKDFKIEIGTTFKDHKRDITIIDRKYKLDKDGVERKYYKYHCNIDGNEDWILESGLLTKKQGCNVCSGNKVTEYNCLWNTDRELCIILGIPKEIAITVTRGSSTPIIFNCKCGNLINIKPCNIIKYKSIGCNCGDNISYPEKFMFNMLTQLGIDFIWQLTKTNFKWCDSYKYDFYFKYNNEEYIIEVHGLQHYEETNRGRSLEEERQNDKLKYELAIKNRINPDNYIVIDFRYSELEWGKKHIINSRLNELFDLSNIDWNKCEEYALKNTIYEVCKYWHEHIEINKENVSTTNLCNMFKLSRTTITRYLKKGTEIGWCNYTGNKNTIIIYDLDMNFIGEYESANWLCRNSKQLFNIKLNCSNICEVARGEKPSYKGYIFKYAKDIDK